jgi:uncharacterized membrane protein
MAELIIFGLLFLALILLFIVCGRKGLRSLFSLGVTIVILTFAVIPLIIKGYDPVLVSFVAAIPITILIIYITEGFNTLSHLSIVLSIVNFFVITLLVNFAVLVAHFTGIVSDVSGVVGGEMGINLPKLLIAGIMFGTLGVLIEMVVTQVATVSEFTKANPTSDKKQIYKQAYGVGVTHLSSIINTLFLIYAGILLPLLIVFASDKNFIHDALNYEPLSNEIVRTLIGTIGLIIAMPTSTALATWWLKRKVD